MRASKRRRVSRSRNSSRAVLAVSLMSLYVFDVGGLAVDGHASGAPISDEFAVPESSGEVLCADDVDAVDCAAGP